MNVSSETVTGMAFAERPLPRHLRADRRVDGAAPAGPVRAGEAVRRAADGRDGRPLGRARRLDPARPGCSGRATTSARCGPWLTRPARAAPRASRSGATSTSTTSRTRCGWRPRAGCRGHEAMYVVVRRQRRRAAAAGADRAPLRRGRRGAATLPREDAGGISFAKAERLIGYRPAHTWRDYLERGRAAARRPARAARARARPASSAAGARAQSRRSRRDVLGAARGATSAGRRVGVVHVERLLLQQALGQAVELVAVLAQQRA